MGTWKPVWSPEPGPGSLPSVASVAIEESQKSKTGRCSGGARFLLLFVYESLKGKKVSGFRGVEKRSRPVSLLVSMDLVSGPCSLLAGFRRVLYRVTPLLHVSGSGNDPV